MSEELGPALRAAADDRGGSRPDVADLWRTGRRRRRARCALATAAAIAVVLACGGAVLAVGSADHPEQVLTTDAPSPLGAGTCVPAPRVDGKGQATPPPPATVEEFVHGLPGGPEPTIVARATVRSVRWFLGEIESNDIRWYHLVELQATDPVVGRPDAIPYLIVDSDPVPPRSLGGGRTDEVIRPLKREVTARISDLHARVDELNRPLSALDEQILEMAPTDSRYAGLVARREQVKTASDDDRQALQDDLNRAQQRLQQLQIAERAGLSPTPPGVAGPPCHRFAEGDDVVVSVVPGGPGTVVRLASPSSFFLVDGDGFSEQLDAARRSVPGWSDSELLRLARESTPDEFLDHLRDAAD